MFASIGETGPDLWWEVDRGSGKAVLSSPAGVVGKLSLIRDAGRPAHGQTAAGAWTFQREAFPRRIAIRRAGSPVTIGVLAPLSAGRGTLTLAGAGEYRLSTHGWACKKWDFNKSGRAVASFERGPDGIAVTIEDEAEGSGVLSVLCLLGCYTVLSKEADAEILTSLAALAGSL